MKSYRHGFSERPIRHGDSGEGADFFRPKYALGRSLVGFGDDNSQTELGGDEARSVHGLRDVAPAPRGAGLEGGRRRGPPDRALDERAARGDAFHLGGEGAELALADEGDWSWLEKNPGWGWFREGGHWDQIRREEELFLDEYGFTDLF